MELPKKSTDTDSNKKNRDEDYMWEKIAEKRDSKKTKFVSHQKTWSKY